MSHGSLLLNDVPHVGIVAATADGAALCYQTLCREAEPLMGRHTHPEITIHTLPPKHYLACIDAGDWAGVAALMTRSASVLEDAGAELIICPNNTLHRAFELVTSSVPWLHIAEGVLAEVLRRHYRRVGLLGTEAVMQGPVYQRLFEQQGIEMVVPSSLERGALDTIIRTELIRGQYAPRSRRDVRKIISAMAAKGADAVILGCTELPLLLHDTDAELPLLDSTRLLATAALHRLTERPWRTNHHRPLIFTSN
jgi:aspartate racemase